MPATIWRGRIAFGMVAIPVRLYKAARRERVRFHNVYRPDAPPRRTGPRLVVPEPKPEEEAVDFEPETPLPVARVHHAPVAPLDETPEPRPIPKENILKGFEIEKDRYVVLEPEEIAAVRPRTSTELAISEFVHTAEIDPVYFDASYYVAPEKGAEKPYAVLYGALAETGYAALGALAMHGREHATIIRPGARGLILHTLYFSNEVRSAEEYTSESGLATPKELELAEMYVRALAAKFDPAKLLDAQEERLRAIVESRRPQAAPAAGESAPPAAAPPDLLDALRKSLAAARKPVKREARSPRPVQTARRPRTK